MMETIKERFSILSKTSIMFILLINALVFFLPLQYQIAIIGLFFLLAFIQMFFSMIDIFLKIPGKIRFVYKRCTYNISKRFRKPDPQPEPEEYEEPEIVIR